MHWTECYDRIQWMSPRAAKIAARMLCKDPLVPSTWVFSLDVALSTRAQGAEPLTSGDLQAIAASRRGSLFRTPLDLDEEQRQAWTLTASIRAQGIEDPNHEQRACPAPRDRHLRSTSATPQETWVLEFSDEFRRLAEGRLSPDVMGRCAVDRLRTDGHRNPLVVAREQFIAGSVR